MPGMTGLELISRVRAISPRIPAVLCTGYSESIHRDEARRLGISEIVSKPVSRYEFASAVQRAIAKSPAATAAVT